MPGILTFESNMPIILIVIIIVLVSIYFFLDSKKSKMQIESLEKKTEVIVKEIDNIHLQLHKFFSKMPTSIIPDTPMKSEDNDLEPIKEETKLENTNNVELSISDFNKLKKDNDNTNTLKEIKSMISDNNTNNSILDEGGDLSNNQEEISENLNNSIIDEINLDEEDDNESINEDDEEDDEVEDVNLSDTDSDKLSEYLEMSVKDLKSKCIEMNLKHSGNKTTLARRIVENL